MARYQSSGNRVKGQSRFANVPGPQISRSKFDRSHGNSTTIDAGFLIPIYVDHALPGDTFELKATIFARLATPLHPIMDNLTIETFFFSVPYRILWDNFKKFMGEQENPADSTDFLMPTTDPGAIGQGVGSMWDYFGLPVSSPLTPVVNALPFRAVNLIWNEWFRDENLQDSFTVKTDDGPDSAALYGAVEYGFNDTLPRRGKRKDYFTSSLPWPQKGAAVQLPLGGVAPVVGIRGISPKFRDTDLPATNTGLTFNSDMANPGHGVFGTSGNTGLGKAQEFATVVGSTNTGLEADLSNATASTINQIREAFQIQRLFERDARGGTRYVELVLSHFGVTSPDQRQQRPEYLGGGSTPVTINPVVQTSVAAATPQGNLAAYGVTANTYPKWIHSFTEHAVVMGFVSVRADLRYQRRVDKDWTKSTKFDYYWPALAHLGEQVVLNKEIYWDKFGVGNEDVWGYQERYAEYRFKPSQITGLMRSNEHSHVLSLDTWHLAQDFGDVQTERPLLNNEFIQERPPIDRIIAVPSEPHFLLDCWFDLQCTRPMPIYSVPGQIDHF